MTVYLLISLPNIPYMHRMYRVLANPKNEPRITHNSNSQPGGVEGEGHEDGFDAAAGLQAKRGSSANETQEGRL
jgi:hypothetical protein